VPGSIEARRWAFRQAHSLSERSVEWVFLMRERTKPSELSTLQYTL
jgi:hypothetical protein